MSLFLLLRDKFVSPTIVEKYVWDTLFTQVFGYPFGSFFWLYMSWCWLGTSLVVSGALAVLAGLLFALNYVRTCNTREHINWSEREVILVTGGAHGVGKRLVETLVDKYSPKKVIVLDISPATFQNDKVVWYSCDLSKRDNIKEVAERILADHGCPTILVNNAGIYKGKQFLEKNDRDIEMTMDVNLMAPIWVTSIFLPKMVASGNSGHIVNVASVLGLSGCAFATVYCASKFGLVGFHEALRQELHGTKIRMSLVYPGFINTGMFLNVDIGIKYLCPPLEPEDVSNAIVKNLSQRVSADIKLPSYGKVVGAITRLLPIEFADTLKNVTNANSELSSFTHSVSAIKNETATKKTE